MGEEIRELIQRQIALSNTEGIIAYKNVTHGLLTERRPVEILEGRRGVFFGWSYLSNQGDTHALCTPVPSLPMVLQGAG